MDGVEVLATQELLIKTAFNWSAFWFALGTVFGVFLLISLIAIVITKELLLNLFTGIVSGAVLGFIVGIFFGGYEAIPIEYQTQYKVTISDKVLMNEFSEKYEIINQEGKIYTVVERDENNDKS